MKSVPIRRFFFEKHLGGERTCLKYYYKTLSYIVKFTKCQQSLIMIKQIQKIIDLFLLIDEQVKGRPISLACMDQIHERFERVQYDIYQLASVIEKGFTKDSWYAVRWDVSNITSELSTLNELINQVLGKKRFQTYKHDQEVQDFVKQGAKEDIIKLLKESLILIKKEFKCTVFAFA